MDKDDIKDNFFEIALGIGVLLGCIVSAPFYGVYLIGKGVYYYLPSNIRKRRMEAQQEQDKKEKARQRDAEIEVLEKQLGMNTKNKFRILCDKYYYKNSEDPEYRSRYGYLKNLRQKAAENYINPDIIVAVECYEPKYYEGLYKASEPSELFDEFWDGDRRILYRPKSLSAKTHHAHKKGQLGSGQRKAEPSAPADKDCFVVLLVHKDYYRVPENALIRHKETIDSEYLGAFSFSDDASLYVNSFNNYMNHFAFHPSQMTEPVRNYFRRLYTLTECGNYDNYFIVQVPGEFQFSDVEVGTDERLNKFIADFKRKYKKVDERS